MSSRRLTLLAGAASALALAVAGCGGDDDAGGGKASSAPAPAPATGAARRLGLKADPGGELRYDKKTLDAKAGPVTIVMSNSAPLSHDVSIEGDGVDEHGEVVGQGGTSKVTADLKPGTYTFYCSVPGHRQGGMEGTLTVK